MRTKVKLKGGISLIVLVITIIVMIILAAAIILSLSNSGIIGKANKAKTDSDTANLKEYVNTLRAEWELMTDAERSVKANSFEEYANKKLADNGYKGAVGADGEVYSNLNENVMAAIRAGIKVGDVVTGYTVTSTTYTTDGSENTALNGSETNPQSQTVTANTALTWKYLGVNANGELEIMADLGEEVAANTKVNLSGKGGYLKGPGMLNTICEKLYSKEGVGTARSMNIDDVNNILGYTGPKGSYSDTNYNTVTTAEPLTIGDIDKKLGTSLGNTTTTPDGKALSTYYADCYFIDKTSGKKEMKNPGNVDLVYNAKNAYWLASPCVNALFGGSYAYFYVRYVYSASVDMCEMFYSNDISNFDTFAVRPVVSLKSNIQLTRDIGETEWKIKQAQN